jgi:hypothetical protein
VGLEFSGLIYAHQLDVTVGQAIRDGCNSHIDARLSPDGHLMQ